MSLDDIIKMNRNRKGPRQPNNRNNGNKRPQQVAAAAVPRIGNQARNQMPKKKLGLLNKSKGINKNRRLNNRQGGGGAAGFGGQSLRGNPRRPQMKNRLQKRPFSNLKSRLSNTKPVARFSNRLSAKPKPQQPQRSNGNKLALNRQTKSFRPNRQQPAPRRAENKVNVAMQVAKKNVEKAKRLLANRISKVKQLSSRFGSRKPNMAKARVNRPVNRAPRVKRLNNKPMVKVNIKSGNPRQQRNKPQIRRNNGGSRPGGGRMVFY